MVVCVLYPRFQLFAALGDRRALLAEPTALAPEPGREQQVGEVSAAAEAFGVVRGMRLGEALSRCPELRLVPPDPQGVRELWGRALDRLEAIGAAVESDQAGSAFFETGGIERLHGGDLRGVLAASGRTLGGAPPLAGTARSLHGSVRLGAAPQRFGALMAARAARPRGRREVIVQAEELAGFLAPLPVATLRSRPELGWLPEVLERLGIATLGELAALPSRAVAERFGQPGLMALDLAQGRDTPLEPRRPAEPVVERLDLPEAASGQQLERALELLVARVLARRERRGRSLRALAVAARFVAGGTWRFATTLRRPSADPAILTLALRLKVLELPAPAESLALEVEAFGPPAQAQEPLAEESAATRQARLGEAVRQTRQSAGADAALRVLEVDPDSRIPERRALLSPFLGEET